MAGQHRTDAQSEAGLLPGTFCHRSLPWVAATQSVGSWGLWTASSSPQPQGETLRSFGQSLSRVGVTQATEMLAAVRSAVPACRTYRTSPEPPNTMDTYRYLIAFRVDDVLAFTGASSGLPLTSQDLDKIHQVCLEQVRRLTGHR